MITRSYHGGCDVIRGVKWIANNWLNVIAWPGSWMVKNGWKKTLPQVMPDQFELHKNEEGRIEKLLISSKSYELLISLKVMSCLAIWILALSC